MLKLMEKIEDKEESLDKQDDLLIKILNAGRVDKRACQA